MDTFYFLSSEPVQCQEFRIQPQTNTENTDFLVEYLTFVRDCPCPSVVIFEFGIAVPVRQFYIYKLMLRRVRKIQKINHPEPLVRACPGYISPEKGITGSPENPTGVSRASLKLLSKS
jgi:hypothetical protein